MRRAAVCISTICGLALATLIFPFTSSAAGTAPAAANPVTTTTPDESTPAPAGDDTSVSIVVKDGAAQSRICVTTGKTVGEALAGLGIAVTRDDRVTPPLDSAVQAGTPVVITRIRTEQEQVTSPIPFRSILRMSHDVAPGRIASGKAGRPGVLTRTFLVTYVNDKPAARKLVSSDVTQQPVDQETLAGIRTRMARALPSRAGTYRRLRCMDMVATGYSPYEGSGSGRCANGMRAGYGIVAVDPRLIHLGTRLYIEGYGYAIAGDTGGAIKGHRVDLGHTTYREAYAVGRRRVKVWILSSN